MLNNFTSSASALHGILKPKIKVVLVIEIKCNISMKLNCKSVSISKGINRCGLDGYDSL